VSDDPLHQLAWLSARSAGLVAWALAGLATILGLAMAARLVDRGPHVRDLHRHLTLATLIAVAGHGVAIALDSFLKAGLLGILVPFTIGYRPLAVAVGLLGGWLLAAFAGSWYLRRRLPPGAWRKLHRFAPLVLVASTVHALTAGSDAGTWWMTAAAFALCGTATGLLALRWFTEPVKAPPRRPAPSPRAPEPEPASLWAALPDAGSRR
jgi:methionine sulfoxide reductase heme-binding subunit